MNNSAALGRAWSWVRWVLLAVLILGVAYVAWGMVLVAQKDKDDEAVAAIHAQKITLADVDGSSLPPTPDKTQNDSTVSGIDSNHNGIRDDVELAIFEKYPGASNSNIRAAELQYAMTEQMFLTRVFDTATWKAVAEENGRANSCLTQVKISWNEVQYLQNLIFNTPLRNKTKDVAFEFITSVGSAIGTPCDVE